MDSALSLLSTGSELSSTDRSIVEAIEGSIEAPSLSDEAKYLIRQMMAKSVRMNVPNVLAIWEIGEKRVESIEGLESRILWIEEGNDKAGYQHMLKHAEEFKILGINENELNEVAKAATTIGDLVSQGKRRLGPGRPVFLLIYKDIPLACAISIGSNGFLVGMNRQEFDKYLKQGPPINKLGRYQSSDAEILPGSATFRGWVERLVPARYEYHKGQQVINIQDTEPIGEWIYSEYIVGPVDQGFHWRRLNFVTRMVEYV